MAVAIDARLVKFNSEVSPALGNMYSEISSLSGKLSSVVGVNNKTKSVVESSYRSINQEEIYGKFDDINTQYQSIQSFVNSDLNNILSMASQLIEKISILEEYLRKIEEAERNLNNAKSKPKRNYPSKATSSERYEVDSYNAGIDAEIASFQKIYDDLVMEFETKQEEAIAFLENLKGNDPTVTVNATTSTISSSLFANGGGTFELYSYNGLKYYMYLPKNVNSTSGIPVTVYLHGKGENSASKLTKNSLPMLLSKGLQPNGIVICPVSRDGMWSESDLVKTKSLVDEVVSTYQADTKKISLAGYSNGAIGAYKMAVKYPDYFSCVVPIAGEYWEGKKGIDLLAKNKIWAFHGSKDASFKIDEVSAKWQNIADAGGTIDASVYEAGHGGKEQIMTMVFEQKVSSNKYTNGEDVYLIDWMQSQINNS